MERETALFFVDIVKKYYKNFCKNQAIAKKDAPVAWVSSFVPCEIVSAMGVDIVYPESYSAVIAASGQEQEFIERSMQIGFEPSVCSYSTCFNGSYLSEKGPKGIPVKPDFLIAANNQCNTLSGWWNYISIKLNVPLFVLDYPGEANFGLPQEEYILNQHRNLIKFIETHTGNTFDEAKVIEAINTSIKTISCWNNILELGKKYFLEPQVTFDFILPLIIAKTKPSTAEFFEKFYNDLKGQINELTSEPRVMWIGYPLWYYPNRYIKGFEDENIKIVINDYCTWWNLEYSGSDWEKQLVHAYNFTYLNKTIATRHRLLEQMAQEYNISGLIFNANKSCKRDAALVYPLKKRMSMPSLVFESDMIDRKFMDNEFALKNVEAFKEILKNASRN